MSAERYQIQKEVGRGGLGIVYLALDTQLGREVAIKRVLTGSGESLDELTQNLVKEAQTLSALNHPNIVTVHDVGRDDDGPYVVMEFLEGETLSDIIERGPLSLADFEELARQTLEGMVAAQSVNLLHRDLKPENIMIVGLPTGKFQVKILDFGLAKFSQKPTTQTMDHGDSIFGSIYFMAPEQFERAALDSRTDLYSLGAIFYYALTGHLPFQGDSAVSVMMAHIEHRVVPLGLRRPDLPGWMSSWIESLFARKMDTRFPNAQAALEAWNPDPVLDEKQVREVASNDGSIAGELFEGFAGETELLLAQLQSELDAGSGAAAAETAQTIRGSASTLGFLEINSIAGQVEENAVSNPVAAKQIAEKLVGAIDRVRNALTEMKWNTP